MKPPLCEFCHKNFRPSSDNQVRFADFKPLPDGMVGHPRGLAWFCDEHIASARTIQHLPLADALQMMRYMFHFNSYPDLTDGTIRLVIHHLNQPDPTKGRVAQYKFHIQRVVDDVTVGGINLRIGDADWLRMYNGHVGYGIDEAHRGHRYAAKACRLLPQVARDHGMSDLWITCAPINVASRRTCELAGAEFVEIVELPSDHDLYIRGWRQVCRYRLRISDD